MSTVTTSTMMQRSRLLPASLAVAALAVSAAWPISAQMQDAPAAEPDPQFEQARGRFHGVWRRSIPEARARQIVDAAIEQTVGAMNFFLRGVARGQLRDNTPLNGRIDLLFGRGGRITVMFDGDAGRRYTTRIGRTARVRTPDGDEMRVTQRLHDDGRLEQVFQTDQGTRWNVYRITADGRMQMDATTQGMMMPQPLHFVFEYARQP